jgi:hypothetical protein
MLLAHYTGLLQVERLRSSLEGIKASIAKGLGIPLMGSRSN